MTPHHATVTELIGARIKQARLRVQLSQQDVADMASMHVANFGHIERGTSNTSIYTLARIASALEVPLTFLVQDIEPQHLPEPHRLISARDLIEARRRQLGLTPPQIS